jgi:hypothetical protein
MSLIPYALRPRAVIRRAAVTRGVDGGSVIWRALALYFVGGPTLLRTNALRQGVLRGNRKWQAIGLLLFVGQDVRSAIRRQPESLGKWKVRSNEFVSVINAAPMTKKERRRRGITRDAVVAQAVADAAAARPGARIVVKSK